MKSSLPEVLLYEGVPKIWFLLKIELFHMLCIKRVLLKILRTTIANDFAKLLSVATSERGMVLIPFLKFSLFQPQRCSFVVS